MTLRDLPLRTLPLDDAKLSRGCGEARSAALCRRAAWLLALTMVGCATPLGQKVSRGLGLQMPAADRSQMAAAGGLDQRRDEMQFQLAEARWRRNDLQACQQTLEEVVSRNPGHRGAHLRLAELYLLKNQPYQAMSLMRHFCQAHRHDADAHHLLGLSYEAIGQGDRALAAYDVAASLDPEDPIVRISLENAVAARETPQLTVAHAARTTPVVLPPGNRRESQLGDVPPWRSPHPDGLSASHDEPKRLDHDFATAAADKSGPRVEIVPVEVPSKNAARPGVPPDMTSDGAKAIGNSDNLPSDDVMAPVDAPSQPGTPGKSPVRWAYELEVGHVKPALREKVEDDSATEEEQPAAVSEATDQDEQEK